MVQCDSFFHVENSEEFKINKDVVLEPLPKNSLNKIEIPKDCDNSMMNVSFTSNKFFKMINKFTTFSKDVHRVYAKKKKMILCCRLTYLLKKIKK